jgi:hypothetical protein
MTEHTRTFTQEQAQAMYDFIRKLSHEGFYKESFAQEHDDIWDGACNLLIKLNPCPKCSGDGFFETPHGETECNNCAGLGFINPNATPQATLQAQETGTPESVRYVVRLNTRFLWNVIDTNDEYVTHGNIVRLDIETEAEAQAAADNLNAGSHGNGGQG